MQVLLNDEQQLYAVACAGGYTCLGYGVTRRDADFIAQALGRPDLAFTENDFGALQGYEKYRQACQAWGDSVLSRKTWFTPGTDPKVAKVLEALRGTRQLVRVFQGHRDTGRDWMEENDVVGRISRSCGTQKVPLLVAPGEDGGAALLTDCILRIIDLDGEDLYRHPKYRAPELYVAPEQDETMRAQGYHWTVLHEGEVQARFATVYGAAEHVEFIAGRIPVRYSDLQELVRAAA